MSFNWCFIGTGKIAHRVAKQIITIDGHRIVSVYNRTKEKALTFAKIYNSRVYDTALEAINDPAVDGVYIATTNETHFPFIKLCLENHKPTLCEKPLTGNAKQLQYLLELSVEKKTFLCEGMWTWFNPISHRVKEWIKQHKIGNILDVKCCFCVPIFGRKNNARLVEIDKYGGALLDLGVYCVRYVYELFGIPKSILSEGKLYRGVDFVNKAKFFYDNFTATITSSFNHFYGDYCLIKGEEGTIKVPLFHRANKAILKNKNGRTVYRNTTPKFVYQFLQVANDIKSGKKESLISLKSSLEVLQLMDEIRKQVGVVYQCDLDSP
ncbi:MAG: Gfo/Idh/MocA family oxidoreductase [Erysipelotrichia bacterium]|nr:Gfo/Idh/MocA family oxidoreductase [Erysipelotrichia bacterium]